MAVTAGPGLGKFRPILAPQLSKLPSEIAREEVVGLDPEDSCQKEQFEVGNAAPLVLQGSDRVAAGVHKSGTKFSLNLPMQTSQD